MGKSLNGNVRADHSIHWRIFGSASRCLRRSCANWLSSAR
jgi:hypothetical protein